MCIFFLVLLLCIRAYNGLYFVGKTGSSLNGIRPELIIISFIQQQNAGKWRKHIQEEIYGNNESERSYYGRGYKMRKYDVTSLYVMIKTKELINK